MNVIISLFLAGVLLLAAEVVLPGAIAGIVGALFLVAGCVIAFAQFGFVAGWTAVGAAAGLGILTLVIEFWLLPRTPWGKKFFLHKAVNGTSHPAPGAIESLRGKVAITTTPLVPTGYINLDGRQYEAFCQDGSAEAGASVRIVGMDTFRIIVTNTLTQS